MQTCFQTLLKNDLVDELHLITLPITLAGGTIQRYFKVTESQIAQNGIIIANYERDGDVKTGAPHLKEDD